MHDFLSAIATKRDLPADQVIHGDPDGPYVDFFGVFLKDDLRRHVSWGSNSGGQDFIVLDFSRYSKIYKLNVMRITILKQDILGLDIPVDYSIVV